MSEAGALPPDRTDGSVALRKLARTLGVPVERIGYLAEVPDRDINEVRRGVADLLFESTAAGMRRVAAAAQVIPSPIAAKLATRNGPVFAAHLAEVFEPRRAIGVGKRLRADFLAEIASHLDLRRVGAVIAGLPRPLTVAVAQQLADRQDWLTFVEIMAVAPDDVLAASLVGFDAGVIRQLAGMIDDTGELSRVAAVLADPLATEIRAMRPPGDDPRVTSAGRCPPRRRS